MRRLQALQFEFVRTLALDYVARRETTTPKLNSYLKRKFENYNDPQVQDWFQKIILECVEKKYIHHPRFAESLSREYQRKKKGPRYIKQKLKEKGLMDQEIELSTELDFDSALKDLLERWVNSNKFAGLEHLHEKRAYLTRKALTAGYDYSKVKSSIEDILKELK